MHFQSLRELQADLHFVMSRDRSYHKTFGHNTIMVRSGYPFSDKILTHNSLSWHTFFVGVLEELQVPFRMTRNITEFIGPFILEGVLVPSFAITSSTLHVQRTMLKPILHLLMRDDVMAWYTSKSSAKNDQKMQEVECQLFDQIWKNVQFVQDCLEECSPREVLNAGAEAVQTNPDPIDAKVRYLINVATSAEKLSLMPAAYHPWL